MNYEKIQRNDYLVKWNKAYKKADVVKILKEERMGKARIYQ